MSQVSFVIKIELPYLPKKTYKGHAKFNASDYVFLMDDIKSVFVPGFTPVLNLQNNRINRYISIYGKMGTKTLRLGIFKTDWGLSSLLVRSGYLVTLDIFLIYILKPEYLSLKQMLHS